MHIGRYLGSDWANIATMPIVSLPTVDTPTSEWITANYGISDSTAEQWHTCTPSPELEDPSSPLSPLRVQLWKELKERHPEEVKEPAPSTKSEFLKLVEQLNCLEVHLHQSPTPDTAMDIVAAQGWAGQPFHTHAPHGSKLFCAVLNYELETDEVLSNTLQLMNLGSKPSRRCEGYPRSLNRPLTPEPWQDVIACSYPVGWGW